MKAIYAVIFGIFALYTWNYLLIYSFQKGLLFAIYLMTGFLSIAVYSGPTKPGFKNILSISITISLVLSAFDIISSEIFFSKFLFIALVDSILKIGFTVAGSLMFYFLYPVFQKERKFIFSDVRSISRRIVSGLIDLNIILFIFAGLSLLSFVIKLPSLIESILIISIIFSYKAVQEIQFGQTPGKRIMGVHTTCSIRGALARNIPFALLFAAPLATGLAADIIYSVLFIDFAMILSGKRLFDFVSGTSVEAIIN